MDYGTIAKAASKVARAAAKYVDRDLHTWYGLAAPAWAVFTGEGVGVLGKSLEAGVVEVGPLAIYFFSTSQVRLECAVFAAAAKLWNGPNGIPDNLGDGSMEMSLWHDLIWEFARQIAEALGVTEQDVMKWGDGILAAGYRGYGARRGSRTGWRARVAYNVVEWSRRWWRKLFPALLAGLTLGILAGCSGCATPPDWELDDGSEIEWSGGE